MFHQLPKSRVVFNRGFDMVLRARSISPGAKSIKAREGAGRWSYRAGADVDVDDED